MHKTETTNEPYYQNRATCADVSLSVAPGAWARASPKARDPHCAAFFYLGPFSPSVPTPTILCTCANDMSVLLYQERRGCWPGCRVARQFQAISDGWALPGVCSCSVRPRGVYGSQRVSLRFLRGPACLFESLQTLKSLTSCCRAGPSGSLRFPLNQGPSCCCPEGDSGRAHVLLPVTGARPQEPAPPPGPRAGAAGGERTTIHSLLSRCRTSRSPLSLPGVHPEDTGFSCAL